MKFELGQVYMTRGIAELFADDMSTLAECLARHASGDWGELGDEDQAQNELALTEGLRLLSAYNVHDIRIWIITEWDRQVTTILLPEEY